MPIAADNIKPLGRVLVVDDEAGIRVFAARVLADAGYATAVAGDGAEALRMVDEQAPFDLFVVDINMPEMRGDELARQLRQRDHNVKVLFFTENEPGGTVHVNRMRDAGPKQCEGVRQRTISAPNVERRTPAFLGSHRARNHKPREPGGLGFLSQR